MRQNEYAAISFECFWSMTAVAAPAFAQSFYVVQDVKTKKCTITETRPATSEVTVVSGDTVYKTKAEAEAGMRIESVRPLRKNLARGQRHGSRSR